MLRKLICSLISCALILCTVLYCLNIDMYRMVGDYRPSMGYGTLVKRLKDTEWVNQTCEDWGTSTSPVLKGLYSFATAEDARDPTSNIIYMRYCMVAWCLTSLACWPAFLMSVVLGVDRKHLKELHKL